MIAASLMPSPEPRSHHKPSRVSEVAYILSRQLAFDAQAAEMIFREEAPHASWFEAAGDVVEGISDKARFADMVIVGQYEGQGAPETHPLPIAHSLIVRCGRPVLVVPAAVDRFEFAHIAVAWDGSREAVRAIHDALPLLSLSRSVQIVTVLLPSAVKEDNDTESLSDHLKHHSINVGATVLLRTPEERDALAKEIDQGPYDLLVMGGYSQSIWWEFIFGGTTQSLLLSSAKPILVSH